MTEPELQREVAAEPESGEPEADANVGTGTPVTGEPRVDEALARLRDVEGAPLTDHVAAYDDVHRLLQDALADLDGE